MEEKREYSILIVEDSQLFRKSLSRELEPFSYNISFAENGEKGIDLFKSTDFDLIILDIELPGINGFEVLKQIKKINYERKVLEATPVIFLTGNDTFENRRLGFDLGALDFIGKKNLTGNISRVVNKLLRPGQTFSGLNSLILDDSIVVRTIVKTILEEEGMNVFEAATAQKAHEILEDNLGIDLIIVDKELPQSDGLDFVKEVRQNYPNTQVPILVISGTVIKDAPIQFFNAGADDYLAKPFIKEEFIARVRSKLEVYQMDRALRESFLKLRSLNEFKDKFLSQCTHDMKSPLATVSLAADVIEKDGNLSDRKKSALKSLRRAVNNLDLLVKEILDLRRIELNSSYELKEISLADPIRNSVKVFQDYANRKNIHLDVILPKEDCTIMGDAFAVERVFCNLISNAIKFSNEEGEINIEMAIIGNSYFTSISDHGIGMSDEQLQIIFDEEYISSSTGTDGEIGTGLGLSICKSICDKHNAQIDVESEEGKGTKFTIEWPQYAHSF